MTGEPSIPAANLSSHSETAPNVYKLPVSNSPVLDPTDSGESPLQHVGDWELWQRAARRAERTVTERVALVERFGREARVEPAAATSMQIVRWLTSHPEWGPSTSATYFAYLQSFYKWLVLFDHRPDNPMVKLVTPRAPQRSPRPVADADLLKLLQLPRVNHRTRVMILLAALAGFRVSEVAAMRGESIDHQAGRIYVVGKGGKQAWVPLHPIIAEVADTMPLRGWWFPGNSRRPGQHVLPKGVSDIIGNAMRRAGIVGTPHALRHWYASSLLDAGADLRTVQELMRHSSVQTTQVYTRVPDARRTAAVGRLDPFAAA